MKKFSIILFLYLFCFSSQAATMNSCNKGASWLRHSCKRLHQLWTEGSNEFYFSGYAWHNRYTYSPARIKTYNELAWGGGLGKGLYDEEGDWHGLYAIAFLDSHKNVEPAIGYSFLKIATLSPHLRLGAGYSVLLTARPDILHNIPFPGVLPWVTLIYHQASLAATYIPGSHNTGNVLFILGKWTL